MKAILTFCTGQSHFVHLAFWLESDNERESVYWDICCLSSVICCLSSVVNLKVDIFLVSIQATDFKLGPMILCGKTFDLYQFEGPLSDVKVTVLINRFNKF